MISWILSLISNFRNIPPTRTINHNKFSQIQPRLTAPGASTLGESATRSAVAAFSMARGPLPATQMAARSVWERPSKQGAATLIRAQVISITCYMYWVRQKFMDTVGLN